MSTLAALAAAAPDRRREPSLAVARRPPRRGVRRRLPRRRAGRWRRPRSRPRRSSGCGRGGRPRPGWPWGTGRYLSGRSSSAAGRRSRRTTRRSTASAPPRSAGSPRGGASRRDRDRSCRTTSARRTRRSPPAAATAVTASALDDPPPHLRRPPAGHRDRAPRVPDAVVAGDVRARAVQARRRLPRRARATDRLVGYVICSRYDTVWHVMNVAVDPDARRHGHRHGAARAALLERVGDDARAARSRCARPTRPRSRCTSASASAPPALRRRYYQDNGEDA